MPIIIFGVPRTPERRCLGQENLRKEEIIRIKILLAIGFVIMLVLTGLVGCTSGTGSSVYTTNQQEGIWVNGHGEVNATPDIAILQLGISAQRASVTEAQAEAATSMGKPTYIPESISYPVYTQPPRMAEEAVAPTTPISPGEMKVSLDIQVVYAILD